MMVLYHVRRIYHVPYCENCDCRTCFCRNACVGCCVWKRPIVVRKKRNHRSGRFVNQWGTVAKTLGGDNVNVTSIINSTNVDAHDYEQRHRISPNCRKRKSSSSMEPATTHGRSKRRNPPTQPSSMPLQSAGVNDGENPHVWFSADVRKAVAQAITEAYEQADAAKKSDFDKLHDQWKSEENNVEKQNRRSETEIGWIGVRGNGIRGKLSGGRHGFDRRNAKRVRASHSERKRADTNGYQTVHRCAEGG